MKFTQIRSRLVTCLAASVCMLFTTHSGAEDWSKIEAAAKQEGKLLVYSTTSRTAKAAKAFSKSHCGGSCKAKRTGVIHSLVSGGAVWGS